MEPKALKEKILKEYSSMVIGLKGSRYEGLFGTIKEILIGEERQTETENPCQLDIVVYFEPLDEMDIEESHPHLNGSSIQEVIIGEDELGFFKSEDDEFAYCIRGKIVCPNCNQPLTTIQETQYTDIVWRFNEETHDYIIDDSGGDSDGKKCPECEFVIEDYMEVLGY